MSPLRQLTHAIRKTITTTKNSPSPPPFRPQYPLAPTASIPGSEGYPSRLPMQPSPPAPGSTLHSLSTNVMFMPDAGPTTDLPRQRAGPADDAADARNALHGWPQAHTALRSHREHAGFGRSGELWSRAQGDGSGDDAAKQLHAQARIPHLVPRRYVPTRTLAHSSSADTG
jgi:hypothetical protein